MTSGDRLYVAAIDGLYVFSPQGQAPVAEVSGSNGGAELFYGAVAIIGLAIITIRILRRRRLA